MKDRERMFGTRRFPFSLSLLLLVALFPHHLTAQSLPSMEAGARTGYIKTTSGEFTQSEAFAQQPLPYRCTLPRNWIAQSGIEMSAGVLMHEGEEMLVVAAGPVVSFTRPGAHWFIEVGSRPTLISERSMGARDFGGPFQFTSHFSIGVIWRQLEIGYRIQHISNARIYSDNDGINMNMLNIGWRF
ncbi:MAG TPA: acyloxyacyl hydrolase [Thermoanaerobaculia bacterium]|nr:acyloxyacyl hydrolase [Thermoanaerobaculia bacterium]